MALIECSECGAEISDKSVKCIKCGAPIEVEKRGWLKKQMAPKIRCTICGYVGKPARVGWDAGGCLISVILLICFIIPGIIYIIWRDSKSAQICCPKCKNLNVARI